MAICKLPTCDVEIPKRVGKFGRQRLYCSTRCRSRRSYQKNTEQYRRYYATERADLSKVHAQREQQRVKRTAWKGDAINHFGGCCVDCGGIFPSECFDFDHVRGEKIIDVSQARTQKQREIELTKCELVCANCHRIRTRVRHYEKVN